MSSGGEIPVVQPAQSGQVAIIRETVRPSRAARILAWLFGILLVVSLVGNCVLANLIGSLMSSSYPDRLRQKYYGGNPTSHDCIAIIRIDGVIVEGSLDFVYRQFRDVAQDDRVKAVVLVIDSPGGSVTASELVHQYVQLLRQGKWEKQANGKPVVAYIESMAASGGYYVAVASDHIVAQPTSVTGSIGVFAAFLDLHELAERHGVAMHVIRRGELKGPSLLHKLTPEERQQWELLVGEAYQRFQQVVSEGRGNKLNYQLREEFHLTTDTGEKVVRRIADGGIFTAQQALKIGLVDQLGFLPDAIQEAQKLANLQDYKVVQYRRPIFFLEELIEARAEEPKTRIRDWPFLTMRLWYLAPGYELAPLPLHQFLLRRP